ncbi:hypothetical protein P692DRAFT_20873137 [Suillus brevipes Sb2]|nr:hypothetical protein P692DRAFT_20873137 [Suillus brevipes Sb2]
MATNSEVFDDSRSIVYTAPPSYDDTISASPIPCSQSWFSFRRMKQRRRAVLSRIRDIVLAPNFTPSSATPNVNACAAALPAAEFYDILTQLNIEGHTALYWAIVHNRPEALWAFIKFVPRYSSVCLSRDLRIACMLTSDHAMFTKLNLARQCLDCGFRCFLHCPPDEIQVHTCDKPTNQFDVVLRVRMFQKRLRLRTSATQDLFYEFIAGGRIWWLRFEMQVPTSGIWHAEIGLSQYSHPARPEAVLLITAHKPGPPAVLKIPLSLTNTKFLALAPWRSTEGIDLVPPPNMTWHMSKTLGDWVMHE